MVFSKSTLAVTIMNDTLINKSFEYLEKGDFFIIFIVIIICVFFYMLTNWKQIFDYYGEHKKSKINAITEALKSEYITGLTKMHLEETLATEHFRISTGIKLEKEFREALIKAHKETKGELSFRHFKRALYHIEYEAGKLHIKISRFDTIAFIVNCLCILVLVGADIMACTTMFIHREEVDWIIFLRIIPFLVIYLAIAFLIFLQMLPIFSASIIEKYFKKNNLISIISYVKK